MTDDNFKRINGFSGRSFLDKNAGMLFIFKTPDYYDFWMKNMKFALDFIWINEDEIVDLIENVSPVYQNTFTAKNKFDKVIEVNSGWTKEKGIKIGDKIEFRN